MKKIRIAQIGIGHDHAQGIMDTLRAYPDVFELAGVAVPEEEKEEFSYRLEGGKDWRCYVGVPVLSVEQVLADASIVAVTVETEEVHLVKYATLAAQHGKHIHMDKPGSLDADAFEELARVAKRGALVFHMGYMYRYNPFVIELFAEADRGALGRILSVEAEMNCTHVPDKRAWLSRFPGGMMFYLGCHMVDFIYRLQGMPEEIIPLNTKTGVADVDSEDFGFAVLRYPHGVSVAKSNAWQVGGFPRRSLVVIAEKKTVVLQPLELLGCGIPGKQSSRRTVYDVPTWEHFGTTETAAPFARYDDMMNAFAAFVRGERENPYSYEYEVTLFRIFMRACGVEIDYKKKIVL